MKLLSLLLLLPLTTAGALPDRPTNSPPTVATTSSPTNDTCTVCDTFYTKCLTDGNPANTDWLRHCRREVCIHGPSQCHTGERCASPACSWTGKCNACDEFFQECLKTCNRMVHECQEGCWKKACVEGPVQCHRGQACQRAECEVPSAFVKRNVPSSQQDQKASVESDEDNIAININIDEFHDLLTTYPAVAKALNIPLDATVPDLQGIVEQMTDELKAVTYLTVEAYWQAEKTTDMPYHHRMWLLGELMSKQEQLERQFGAEELGRLSDGLAEAVQGEGVNEELAHAV